MENQNIISNQEQVFIHIKLENDLAYQYSVKNLDTHNMRIVLRAHGEDHSWEDAQKQIDVAFNWG